MIAERRQTVSRADRTKWWAPPRLQTEVVLHEVNTVAGKPGPLILLAWGAPGVGKTFSITNILEELGVMVFTASAGLFESGAAGDPVRRLEELYLRATAVRLGKDTRRCPAGHPLPSALLVDDVDLILGQFGNLTQYTVNRQHILAFLMSLCDDPSRVFGRRVPRVPVYTTANSPGALHGPLIRSGRARVLHWELLPAEQREVVRRLFPHLDGEDLGHLMASFSDQGVAFFADLRRLWNDEAARREVARTTPREALRLAMQRRWRVTTPPPGLVDLIALGHKAEEARRGTDELEKEECDGEHEHPVVNSVPG